MPLALAYEPRSMTELDTWTCDACALTPKEEAWRVDRSTFTVPLPWLSSAMGVSAVISSCVTNTSSEPVGRSRKPRFDGERPSGSEIVELTKLPLVILTPVALVATTGPCTVTLLTELFADSARTPVYC